MLRSMFAGVSGLQTNQTKMDVVGNNISNLNTTGFKRGRVTFQEMLNQTIQSASAPQDDRGGVNPQEVGLGVDIGSIDTDHTQGNIESTGVETDLAIEGDGFFVVSDGQQNLYTRDGNLEIDANGDLIHGSTNTRIQGWEADNGEISTEGSPEDIQISVDETIPGESTEQAVFGGNLDSRVDGGIHRTGSIDVFDSLGDSHSANLDFVRQIGTRLTGTDGDVTIYQQAYDPEMEGLEISFEQEAGAELEVDGDFNVTADFEGEEVEEPTREEIRRAINDRLMEEGYSGTIELDIETGEIEDLMDVSVELNRPEFGGDNLEFIQDKTAYDQELNGIEVRLIQDDDADEPSGSYSQTDHRVSVDANFAENDLDSVREEINNVLADEGFAGELLAEGEIDSAQLNNEDQQTFTLSAGNRWDWSLDDEMDGVIDGSTGGDGMLVFNSSGEIISGESGEIEFSPTEVGAPQTVEINLENITQQASEHTLDGVQADGYASGDLDSFSFDDRGQIIGNYTNGETQLLGQIAMASFNNPEGLAKQGETMFAASENSGIARIDEPGRGGRGTISAQALEMSNVDLAEEFTEMITTQRGFQANSSLITTSDEMLQELVNLKR